MRFKRIRDQKYKIGLYEAHLPPEHELPIHQKNHPLYDAYFGKWLNQIDSNLHVLDIGANVGDTALFISSNNQGTIVSVEPVPIFYKFLLKNINHNNLEERIIPKNFALLPNNENKGFALEVKKGTATTQFYGGEKKVDSTTTAISIGEFINSQHLHFDLIKSDTDGLDLPLIMDLLDNPNSKDSILFFELDHFFYGTNWRESLSNLLQDFQKLGYRLIAVDNLGRTIAVLENDLLKLIQLYVWIESQKDFTFRSVYYLDIWAFPQSRHEAFERIVKLEGF